MRNSRADVRTPTGPPLFLLRRLSGSVVVLLQDAGIEQFVDELLHGVERTEEALRGHDDADIAFGGRRGAVLAGLQGDIVKADHASREMDLTDSVSEDLFLVCHFFLLLDIVKVVKSDHYNYLAEHSLKSINMRII